MNVSCAHTCPLSPSLIRDPGNYAQGVYANIANGTSQYLGNVIMYQTLSGVYLAGLRYADMMVG